MGSPLTLSRFEWGLFFLLWFSFIYVHQVHFDGPTAVSRLDLLHALFEHGTVCIDACHKNTPDKAVFRGHYYSDKAPGTVALAFVPFTLATLILEFLDIPLDSKTGWLVSSWVSCALSIALITAFGGVATFRWLRRWVEPRPALITTLALFLGAAPWPYSTMMFSHAFVIGLIAMAICLLDQSPSQIDPSMSQVNQSKLNPIANPANGKPQPQTKGNEGKEEAGSAFASPAGGKLGQNRRWHRAAAAATSRLKAWYAQCHLEFWAGFACGWALASEYTAGLIVMAMVLWACWRNWRRVLPFCLGAFPPLLLIPAYSFACFHNPFVLPYSLQASFPQMQHGLYAIQWPDAETAFKLLFSPARGLFFWTPFLAMAAIGYPSLAQRSMRWFWLAYAAPLIQIVIVSGRTWDWPAGPTLGPRFLAPMLPVLALPCALGARRFPRIGISLAALSVGLTMVATLTDATPAGDIQNPLVELHWKLFRERHFSPNLGNAFGLRGYVSAAGFGLLTAALAGALWFSCERLNPERPNRGGLPNPKSA